MQKKLITVLSIGALAWGQVPHFKPGFNLFSKDQDIQLGKEAASQVEQQSQIVRDPRVVQYIQKVGRKLATQPQAGDFPYTFQVVNDKSVNAFALPGGPTFVNTGLIVNADNEAQLAGAMAHEISHVALRHGTNQVSKASFLKIGAALAGAATGGSLLGQLAGAGVNLGANSLLLKFSRSDESQADLNGAQIMASAGYNPIELARFFEKLQSEGGHSGPQFLSDHPNPGNRRAAIEDEIRYLPRQNYITDTPEFHEIQAIVKGLPAPTKTRGSSSADQTSAATQAASIKDAMPSNRLKHYRTANYSFDYPDNWDVLGDSGGTTFTIASKAGLIPDGNGGVQVAWGIMTSYAPPSSGGTVDLVQDTNALIQRFQNENAGMQATGKGNRITVGGSPAISTALLSQSPYRGETEHDTLITVARPEGLFYMVFVTPARQAESSSVQNLYENILRSVRFGHPGP